MAQFSNTIKIDVPEIKPDLTHNLDVSISTDSKTMSEINQFISGLASALSKGKPYPDDFEVAELFEEAGSLPFTKADFKLVIENIPIGTIPGYINLIGAINGRFPYIDIIGKLYMVTPLFGNRSRYDIRSEADSSTLEIQQVYEPVQPGDIDVPDPVIKG